MSAEASTFKSAELTIAVTDDGANVSVAWLGTSDAREPGRELTPYLTELASKLVGKAVDVDFRKLEYMNSGTVAPIIQFARTLDKLGVKTRLLYDSKVGWQRVNFVAMKNIAKTLVHVSVEG
ncbi:hypothetical protein L6R52_10085 [Myxococcota bacterium]|nr:hypothetical protein [Myxococcota bacterium]